MNLAKKLYDIENAGNLRCIPQETSGKIADFTSNDYLGLGNDIMLREKFFDEVNIRELSMTSSASRLLAASQKVYMSLEECLCDSYGRAPESTLLFNSGYHANTGIIPTIADRKTLILADRLVHASIIDGIKLSGAEFVRFRHNDFNHLEQIISKHSSAKSSYDTIMVIVESVYSMDGDCADLSQLSKIKKRYGNIILYVDEAHSVGVRGHAGLGESVAQNVANDIDILVGTFGKALASMGAFAVVNQEIRKYLINTSRSFIFSTVLPPLQVAWTEFVWKYALEADSLRDQLKRKSKAVSDLIPGGESSHIRPLIVGDSDKAVKISQMLLKEGIKALPIRRPTVPPGTERLRFSVCATIPDVEIEHLGHVLKKIAI